MRKIYRESIDSGKDAEKIQRIEGGKDAEDIWRIDR